MSDAAYGIMAKMGWKQGQGLGASGEGMNTCLKPKRVLVEEAGIGSKPKDYAADNWQAATGVFNSVLDRLNKASKGETVESAQPLSTGAALKQYTEKKRLYSKFVKAKDVSTYSDKDKAEIFGQSTAKTVKTESYTNTSMTSHDYFKQKMLERQSGFDSSTQEQYCDYLKGMSNSGKKGLGLGMSSAPKPVVAAQIEVVKPARVKKAKKVRDETKEERRARRAAKKQRKLDKA